MKRLIFMDFEASALRDGYPIEVGWAWAESTHVEARSLLIARADEWHSPGFQWDPIAEGIHGLTLVQLDNEGLPVDFVCKTLNAVSADAEVCFDTGSSGMDRRWLHQLYAESEIPCLLQFAARGADTLTTEKAQRFGIGDVAWTFLERLAPPLTHAAAEDAAHWAWWQIAIEHVAGAGLGGISDQSECGHSAVAKLVSGINIRLTGRTRQSAAEILHHEDR